MDVFFAEQIIVFLDWLDSSPSEQTWENAENLTNAREVIAELHCRNPDKPKSIHRDNKAQ